METRVSLKYFVNDCSSISVVVEESYAKIQKIIFMFCPRLHLCLEHLWTADSAHS